MTDAFTITADESARFARLSGDFNPLHLDPLRARRSHFGGTVVHGIHAFLKALDAWAAAREKPFTLLSARLQFNDVIPTGSPVAWESSDASAKLSLRLHRGAGLVQRNTLRYSDAFELPAPAKLLTFPPAGPAVLTFEQAGAHAGSVDLGFDPALAAQLFPHLSLFMPPEQLTALLATTRIVGMECPGLHSIFMTLEAGFTPGPSDSLAWRVVEADERFQKLTIDLESATLAGSLQAMFRPVPAGQESSAGLRGRLRGDEFRGRRVIVLGGSRGLGELAAKLVAAGGGQVWITYATGSADAARVVDEIRGQGGAAAAFQFDVRNPPRTRPGELAEAEAPDQLYYFATPPIHLNKSGAWDEALFQNFCAFYTTGFERTIGAIRNWWPAAPLAVCYPSTVFLDTPEPGAAEYAAAKAAGEALCRYLSAADPTLRCNVPRLPRMLTDQTNAPGLDPATLADSVSAILALLQG